MWGRIFKYRAALFIAPLLVAGAPSADHQTKNHNPHGDPTTGVERVVRHPSTRGDCSQCHEAHEADGGAWTHPFGLFAPNDNSICFAPGSAFPCHQAAPPGYPADEMDRIPEGLPHAGYFEVNAGGRRVAGVARLERWPGQLVFEDNRIVGEGHHLSPHHMDPDMPRRDSQGRGLCLNCHNPHGTENPFDILTAPYTSMSGWESLGPPPAYGLCLGCHGHGGPTGMRRENQWIEDYYDAAFQGDETAGHQIRFSPKSALAWPATVHKGDRLPCFDCHNPHGSRGHDGNRPNAFLISDQREGWSGLTETATDPEQNRRFCLGCHIPSDGIPGSVRVAGIVMNTIPPGIPEHAAFSFEGCFTCHGSDYGSATAHNVHHPKIP